MHAERDSIIPLYLHIPKCGGSTITNVIYQQCRLSLSDAHKTKFWHRGIYFYPAGLFSAPSAPSNENVAKMLRRPDLTAVVGHFSFGIHEFVGKPCSYVTVLRHPVSRVLSLYDELRSQKHVQTSLQEFINDPPFRGVTNDQTFRIAGKRSLETVDGGSILAEARQNLLDRFAVVGVTEGIDETLFLMHRAFGWTNYCPYYPKNISLNKTAGSSISADVLEMITEGNALDLVLYEFAKEQMAASINALGPEFQSDLKTYKESIRSVVQQNDLNCLKDPERKRTHQTVLDLVDKGKTR